MNDNEKVVAIYTRVSTLNQAHQGHSLEEQKKRLTALCEVKGYKIYKIYTDEAISGKDVEHRPAYQRMIKDMKDKKFNLIMALKLDRLSRSISDFEDLFKMTEKYHCGIELFSGNIDTNGATGMLFARILATFAQFEREIIQERTLIGVEAAVNKGHLGGKPALGYKKDNKVGEDGKMCKVWVVDEEEAKIVREIFNLCLNGKTYFQIAEIMKKKYPNILAFYRTDKKTKERVPVFRSWTDGSICTIINNRHYIGIHDFRKSVKDKETIEKRDLIPAIIDEDTFEECQRNINRNKRNYYRSKEKQYLFIQKLKCPTCGRTLAANGVRNKNKDLYLYYKCKNCGEYVRESWVEKELLKKLNDLLEFNMALDSSFVPIDSETAKALNCDKKSVNLALDEKLIRDKSNRFDFTKLTEAWNNLPYEEKAEFIYQNIDSIEIKKHKYKNDSRVEVIDFNLRKNKVTQFLEMGSESLLESLRKTSSPEFEYNVTEMKNEFEVNDYLTRLREKYDIKTIEISSEDMWDKLWMSNIIKKIKIPAKNVIQKDKYIIVMAR